MAAGTLSGAILETFDIRDELSCRGTAYLIEPELDARRQRIDIEKCGIGFADLSTSDSLIYAAYGGNRDFNFNNIAVFDWQTRPIAIWHADNQINKLCYDPDHRVLYALLLDENSNHFFGKLKLPE